ncbi:MAG: tetratricopeptide repeat protein [Acidobacteria bacterium]|uniref:Tetratricopeptide repeat protein n=1 Tax=Candidatus Polarisedimenticola svalbardensis TaxID=2886004 RepID=A0A8J7C1J1_9BACT|nr:tetratricopeptide repeat protein [Candidatus Polarisedimenticola svalbardensis]
MASDRDKALKAAEKLLKGGKQPVALAHFRKLSTSYPEDLVLHNRIGDMLCLNGLGTEAVPYYEKVAFAYRDSGFMPKAVAMFKKILRQQPDSFETMVELGNLYLRQKLPGEARNFLLHAADQYIQNSGYDRAREIYRTLIDAEPDNSGHRIRLAETMAAAGEPESAVTELLATAESMTSSSAAESRMKVLYRAKELAPADPKPVLAIACALEETGQPGEALQFLDEQLKESADGAPFLQAKLRLLVAGDGHEAALALLTGQSHDAFGGEDFVGVLETCRKGPGEEAFWSRIDPWLAGAGAGRAQDVLEAAAGLDRAGHVPALTRLIGVAGKSGDTDRETTLLERLVTVLHGSNQKAEASVFQERLRELNPNSRVLTEPEPEEDPGEAVIEEEVVVSDGSSDADLRQAFPELEAPAVPLNKTDEEFAAGRLTQAEILEKYGLEDKALEQVREVVERFPGFVAAQKRLVDLVKTGKSKEGLRDAYLGLAFAERASGHLDEARKAAKRAESAHAIDDGTRQGLLAFHLIGDIVEHPVVETAPTADEPAPPQPEAVQPEPVQAAPPVEAQEDIDVCFDEEEPEPEPVPELSSQSITDTDTDVDGDDLASLAAALEGELFLDDDEPLVPEAPREQSLDEVFAAFQRQVEKQVDSDDFQTHYDLGIAYREMGLLDEAIAEFERTARPGGFQRESTIMIASCHRDAGRISVAADWYRKALDIPSDDPEAQSGLRYDLAEVLAEVGEMNEALDLYRVVQELDPSFRDIALRVSQLEARLGN